MSTITRLPIWASGPIDNIAILSCPEYSFANIFLNIRVYLMGTGGGYHDKNRKKCTKNVNIVLLARMDGCQSITCQMNYAWGRGTISNIDYPHMIGSLPRLGFPI